MPRFRVFYTQTKGGADLLPQGLLRGEALRTAGAFSDQRPPEASRVVDMGSSHGWAMTTTRFLSWTHYSDFVKEQVR